MNQRRFWKGSCTALCLLLAALLFLPACAGEEASVPSLKEVEKYESLFWKDRDIALEGLGFSENDIKAKMGDELVLKGKREMAGQEFRMLLHMGGVEGDFCRVLFNFSTKAEDAVWEILETLLKECKKVYGTTSSEEGSDNRISERLLTGDTSLKSSVSERWQIGKMTECILTAFRMDSGALVVQLQYYPREPFDKEE